MRRTITSLLAGAALATIAGAAGAQTYGGYYPPYGGYGYDNGYGNTGYGQTATLYELPGFQGRSIVVNGSTNNLDDMGFNDRARSVRFNGTWKLCEDAGYRGHCEILSGSVADLRSRGINGLSSIGPYNDYGAYPGGGYGRGVQGRSVVFYAGPVSSNYSNGYPPYGNGYGYGVSRRTADDFCRSMGNREAIYYDSAGGTLQDVLCRR
jgi:hypothetical protein